MKKPLYFLIFVLLSSIALADTLNNTVINATNINTTLTVNQTIYFTDLIEDGNFIYFNDYNYSLGSEYLISDLNITSSNKRYYVNSSRRDLPYISSNTSTSRTITSALNLTYNASLRFNVDCAGNPYNPGELITITQSNTGMIYGVNDFTCYSTYITLNALNLGYGNVEFTFDVVPARNFCDNIITNLQMGIIFIGILILAFFGMLAVSIFQRNDMPDGGVIAAFMISIGMACVVLVVYIVIISQMC